MTAYMRDGDQVSFAAASIYPLEPSPVVSAPQPARPEGRRAPRPARPQDGGPTPPSAAGGGRRCSPGPPRDDDGLDALDIPTVCRRSGLGRSYVYEAIRRGELRARKFGRATRVLRPDYESWLAAAPPVVPTPPSERAVSGSTPVPELVPRSGAVRDDQLSKRSWKVNRAIIGRNSGPPGDPINRAGVQPRAHR
jgi:excisionase family DNA binding protein